MADTLAPVTQAPVNKLKNRLEIINNPIGYICIGGGISGYFVAKHYNKSKVGGVVIGFFAPLVIVLGVFAYGAKNSNGTSW